LHGQQQPATSISNSCRSGQLLGEQCSALLQQLLQLHQLPLHHLLLLLLFCKLLLQHGQLLLLLLPLQLHWLLLKLSKGAAAGSKLIFKLLVALKKMLCGLLVLSQLLSKAGKLLLCLPRPVVTSKAVGQLLRNIGDAPGLAYDIIDCM
jgi:hypothetical protein